MIVQSAVSTITVFTLPAMDSACACASGVSIFTTATSEEQGLPFSKKMASIRPRSVNFSSPFLRMNLVMPDSSPLVTRSFLSPLSSGMSALTRMLFI